MLIHQLSEEERTALKDGLALAAKMVDGKLPLSVDQVQKLYDALSTGHRDYDVGIITLGLSFGETIIAEAGYEWVRVEDEYGEETVLSPKGKQIICSPISMIQKRIDQSEDIDVSILRDETIRLVQDRIYSGDYDER